MPISAPPIYAIFYLTFFSLIGGYLLYNVLASAIHQHESAY